MISIPIWVREEQLTCEEEDNVFSRCKPGLVTLRAYGLCNFLEEETEDECEN